MRLRKTLLSLSALLFLGSASPSFAAPFIDFTTGAVKVVFDTINLNGTDYTRATATTVMQLPVDPNDPTGPQKIEVRSQTQVVLPDGSGGFFTRVTQQLTIATPVPGSPTGNFNVTTTTETLETPSDANGTSLPGAVTTTSQVIENRADVTPALLNLPISTEFFPSDVDLDEPLAISAG